MRAERLTTEEWAELNKHLAVSSAAPDMLAALKAIRLHCPCDYDINPRFEAAWNLMLAAIAKAEGR